MPRVYPLLMGLLGPDSLPEDPEERAQQKADTPGIVFYIEGVSELIMVDAGLGDTKLIEKKYSWKAVREPGRTLRESLTKFGLKPEDVETVIITHLHWDHMGEAEEFRNAIFIVQERELEAASVAGDPAISGYDPWTFERLDCNTVNGDARIAKDIRVVFTPGHTVGHQSVVVTTGKGRVVVAGDAVFTYGQWEENLPAPFSVDEEQSLKSLYRLKRIADVIIPSHDMRVLGREYYP